MEHEAPAQRAMPHISPDMKRPALDLAPDRLATRLRRALADPLAALRHPSRLAGTLSSATAAYIATALDVLELLTADGVTSAPLQAVTVELADVLMQLLATLKSEAPRHSLELALPGDNPAVLADEQIVTRATQLLLAATIALAPHGGTVRVSLRGQDDGALIAMRQQETLLPEDRLRELFEPFPVVPELDTPQRATLLYLAVARRLVESHCGSIWAEAPTRASGMTFYVWWPQAPTLPVEAAASPIEQAPAPAPLPLHRDRPVLLILEGDARMARYLRANTEVHGFQTHTCANEEDALDSIDREEPDLLLVDSGLPAMDDAGLLARLRQYASGPILVLGHRTDPRLCARLLDAGAADYIPRPFNIEELVARMRAALRASQATSRAATQSTLVAVGKLEIDLAHQQVRESGRSIALSRTEYRLLRVLAQHPGMVISHAQLLERVWGAGYHQETEFLWVYVRRLRRKIEPDPAHPRYILTAPGLGYQLADARPSTVEAGELGGS